MGNIKNIFLDTKKTLNIVICLSGVLAIFSIISMIMQFNAYKGAYTINFAYIVRFIIGFIPLAYFCFVRFNKKIKLSKLNLIYVMCCVFTLICNIGQMLTLLSVNQNVFSYILSILLSIFLIAYIYLITWNKKLTSIIKKIISILPFVLIALYVISFIYSIFNVVSSISSIKGNIVSITENINNLQDDNMLQYYENNIQIMNHSIHILYFSILISLVGLFNGIFIIAYFKQFADYKVKEV